MDAVDAVDAAGNIGTKGRTVTYDLEGNRTGETFYGTKVNAANNAVSSGTVAEVYSYDALNRLTAVARDGTAIDSRLYDSANRVVQSGGSQSVAYYNALYGAGAVGTGAELRITRYDANGRTAHVRVMNTAATAKYNLSYSNYDAAGNLLGYTLSNYQGTAYTNTYTYGLLRRDAYKESTVSGTSFPKANPVKGQLSSLRDHRKLARATCRSCSCSLCGSPPASKACAYATKTDCRSSRNARSMDA